MLDFRVVIAACIAGVVILFGGIGLVASLKIAHEPVRPANRIVERPRVESNASLPVVIETPAVKPAPPREAMRPPEPAPVPAPVPVAAPEPAPVVPPVEALAPAPVVPPVEITGTIAPAEPFENPRAAADLPVRAKSAAKKTPRRPRPAAPAPAPTGPFNPFAALFGGFNQNQ